MAEAPIELRNYTGKELCFKFRDTVIDIPKQDTVMPSDKHIVDEMSETKLGQWRETNFGRIIIPNFCPVKAVSDHFPKWEKGIYYIVLPEVAMRYQRIDFVYPEQIEYMDDFHITFRWLGFFHF